MQVAPTSTIRDAAKSSKDQGGGEPTLSDDLMSLIESKLPPGVFAQVLEALVGEHPEATSNEHDGPSSPEPTLPAPGSAAFFPNALPSTSTDVCVVAERSAEETMQDRQGHPLP